MTFLTVLKRELVALITLPQTYGIAAAYLIISGVFFVNILTSTSIPDLTSYYDNVASTLIVLCPIIAMRSFAEERKSGALDLTLSWPISRSGLVLGKFAANTLFAWVLVSISWLYVRLVEDIATISVARAAGGFIGMLFLAATFSAISLMVASRATSPTGAAFLGFGLCTLLTILDYAPVFIRQTLRQLGTRPHFEPFPRGVIRASDCAYFVVVCVAALALAVLSLAKHSPGRATGSAFRRSAVVVAAIVLLGAGLSLGRRLDGEHHLGGVEANRVTQATRDVVKRTEGAEIQMTGFVRPASPEAEKLRKFVEMYRSAGANMEMAIVDPDIKPVVAKSTGINDYNQYELVIGKKRAVFEGLDQSRLTKAILRLVQPRVPTACFTIGHGERDATNTEADGVAGLAGELRTISYSVTDLALAGVGGAKKLGTCDVVLVMGPVAPFLPTEHEMLEEYLAGGGRMVVMPDGAEGAPVQLNELLEPVGITFGSGIVRDKKALADDPSAIVSSGYDDDSPITAQLTQRDLPAVFVNALPVELEGRSVTDLVRSSKGSRIESEDGKVLRRGPFTLAATGSGQGEGQDSEGPARVAVAGSVNVVSNRLLSFAGNRTFASALVQWVTSDDDLIAASRDNTGLFRVSITQSQRDSLIRNGIALPVIAFLLPAPVTLLRLKRG